MDLKKGDDGSEFTALGMFPGSRVLRCGYFSVAWTCRRSKLWGTTQRNVQFVTENHQVCKFPNYVASDWNYGNCFTSTGLQLEHVRPWTGSTGSPLLRETLCKEKTSTELVLAPTLAMVSAPEPELQSQAWGWYGEFRRFGSFSFAPQKKVEKSNTNTTEISANDGEQRFNSSPIWPRGHWNDIGYGWIWHFDMETTWAQRREDSIQRPKLEYLFLTDARLSQIWSAQTGTCLAGKSCWTTIQLPSSKNLHM